LEFQFRSDATGRNWKGRRCWADFHGADQHGPFFDHKTSCLDIAKKAGGGSEDNRLAGMKIGYELAADFRRHKRQGVRPTKTVADGNDELRRLESAFDFGGVVDFKRALGGKLPQQSALENDFSADGIGVEKKTALFDDKSALGLEILGDGIGDLVIAQVHVAAAPLAHGGLCGERHIQFGATVETRDPPLTSIWLQRPGHRLLEVLKPEVLVTLPANGGVSRGRLRLRVPALGAGDGPLLHFHRCPLNGRCPALAAA